MKNKLFPLFLAACAVTIFSASLAAAKPVKIGFILKTMQEERYQRDKAAFIKAAEALGAKVYFDSANNDEQVQLAKFENMLAKGCKVIVLQPVNTGTAGNMVKMANEEGVKVVGYDSMLRNGPLDAMVMQDSWAVGKLQGEAMTAWLKEKKGKIKVTLAVFKFEEITGIEVEPLETHFVSLGGAILPHHKAPPCDLVESESYPLLPKQKEQVQQHISSKYTAWLCEAGTGKTLCTLTIAYSRWRAGIVKHTFVLVPASLVKQWKDLIKT